MFFLESIYTKAYYFFIIHFVCMSAVYLLYLLCFYSDFMRMYKNKWYISSQYTKKIKYTCYKDAVCLVKLKTVAPHGSLLNSLYYSCFDICTYVFWSPCYTAILWSGNRDAWGNCFDPPCTHCFVEHKALSSILPGILHQSICVSSWSIFCLPHVLIFHAMYSMVRFAVVTFSYIFYTP